MERQVSFREHGGAPASSLQPVDEGGPSAWMAPHFASLAPCSGRPIVDELTARTTDLAVLPVALVSEGLCASDSELPRVVGGRSASTGASRTVGVMEPGPLPSGPR
jgi:hypothetical protein